MYGSQRRRLQWRRVLCLLAGVLVCCVYQRSVAWRSERGEAAGSPRGDLLHLESREVEARPKTTPEKNAPNRTQQERDSMRCIYVLPLPKPTEPPTPPPVNAAATPTPIPKTTPLLPPGDAPHMKGDYPGDLFSVAQRREGWVLLHFTGMLYMFVALAIVCDEFFVPVLGVITDKLAISDDVAGATFMAAGGSAPELFTSLIGVFVSHSNVGIGTIVGSAVFNILFVIGMCALFSREVLQLTWWPLFRDVSFYILDLLMLIVFFLDSVILWWEAALLLGAYGGYVGFMKYNIRMEREFKALIGKHQSIVRVMAVEESEKDSEPSSEEGKRRSAPEDKNRLRVNPLLQRGGSSASPSLHNSTMRNSVYQLMIHTLRPLGEDRRGKSDQPTTISVQVTPPVEPSTSKPFEEQKQEQAGGQKEISEGSGGSDGSESSDEDDSDEDDSDEDDSDEDDIDEDDDSDKENEEKADDEEEEGEEPLSLDWPETRRNQATYLFLLPIVFPLWLTVPDVRRQTSTKYFVVAFLGSILWIGIFSYLMVWWAHQVGETISISEEMMGLTILAAGTSIPDLITSVIVARRGLGNMAVSSSVGSNIFDITVGLPLPWLLYSVFNGMAPVVVRSNGLFCAIILLFLMLLFVIVSIVTCKWRMSKRLGITMFLLYILFLLLSVMLEDRIISCPISV